LLEQLAEVPDENRTARFVCVLAVADPTGRVMLTTRATMDGRIGRASVGTNGFGYDPLFVVQGLDRTSAELEPAEKNRLSHRGKALRRMKDLMHGVKFEKLAK
jgi:XTP/dITP diphosphohydrolase